MAGIPGSWGCRENSRSGSPCCPGRNGADGPAGAAWASARCLPRPSRASATSGAWGNTERDIPRRTWPGFPSARRRNLQEDPVPRSYAREFRGTRRDTSRPRQARPCRKGQDEDLPVATIFAPGGPWSQLPAVLRVLLFAHVTGALSGVEIRRFDRRLSSPSWFLWSMPGWPRCVLAECAVGRIGNPPRVIPAVIAYGPLTRLPRSD